MKAQEHSARRYKPNSMSLHSRTHLSHLHVLKTSSRWDSPPVEEPHSKPKTGTATQYPPTSLLGGDATNPSHQNHAFRLQRPKPGTSSQPPKTSSTTVSLGQTPRCHSGSENWDPQSLPGSAIPKHPYHHHYWVRSQSVTIYGVLSQLSQ